MLTLDKVKSENSTPDSPAKTYSDLRLKHPKFRAAVRLVLAQIGVTNNMGNFRKYDKIYDWYAFARNIERRSEHPTFKARVYMLCNNKNIQPEIGRLMRDGGPIIVNRDLPGHTREEAAANIGPNYEWKEWI